MYYFTLCKYPSGATEIRILFSKALSTWNSEWRFKYSHTAVFGLSPGAHGRSGNAFSGKSSTIVSNTTQKLLIEVSYAYASNSAKTCVWEWFESKNTSIVS